MNTILELVSDWLIMLQISEETNAKGGAAGYPLWRATVSAQAGISTTLLAMHSLLQVLVSLVPEPLALYEPMVNRWDIR